MGFMFKLDGAVVSESKRRGGHVIPSFYSPPGEKVLAERKLEHLGFRSLIQLAGTAPVSVRSYSGGGSFAAQEASVALERNIQPRRNFKTGREKRGENRLFSRMSGKPTRGPG